MKTNNIMNTQNLDGEYAVFAKMSVEWKQIWCVKKEKGVEFHCNFVINNAKDTTCELCVSLLYAESNYQDFSARELYDYTTRKCPPIRISHETITPSYDSVAYNDVTFEYPYSDLLSVEDSFKTKLTFKREEVRLFTLCLKYNNRHFPCEAIFPLEILGEKKLLSKPEYFIQCADKTDIVLVPFDNNGEYNDPAYIAALQKIAESKTPVEKTSESRTVFKPRPLNCNPLSEALRKVMDTNMLSSPDVGNIIHVDSKVNEVASVRNIPWDEFFKPDTEYYISNALLALVDNQYIRSSLRVKYLITSLRKKGL